MKKIFFILSTNSYSGAEAVNFSIISGLKEKYDFYWVSPKGKINENLIENNIKWIEIKSLNPFEIKRVIDENRPDIIHATDFKASCISSIFGNKVPVISHIHHNNPWIRHINIKTLYFLMCTAKLKQILTVSPSIEKEYVFSKYIKNKIICVSNPVSCKKVLDNVSSSDYEKKYDICCTARISSEKRPQMFINIVARLVKKIPSIKVIWIGEGELKEKCIEQSKRLGLNDNIEFVGFKKNPYKYMAKSKLFMLTSSFEGFGLSAFEALTLGLPCIVSNVGGLKNVVTNQCGMICENEEEFYNMTLELLTDEKKYKQYCKNAKMRAKEIDNYDNYMDSIDKIYKKVSKYEN